MREHDTLHRFIIENSHVRGELVHLDATWRAVLERADYPEVVRAVLGEALASVALLAATIKFEGSLILQIRGNGPLHLLVTQATHDGTLRGLARWHGDVPEGDLSAIFGEAQMAVTIEQAQGSPYQGIIMLQGASLAESIEAYFTQSEQLSTRLWLAAGEDCCAGLLLQELPGEEKDLDVWQRAEKLAATITADELLQLPAVEILHRLYHEEDVRLFDAEPRCFRCSCSRERIEAMLHTLGIDEVRDIVAEQGKVGVDCEFCNAHYEFDAVDVEMIFMAVGRPDISDTSH